MSSKYQLSQTELMDLWRKHHHSAAHRHADRLKAVILLASGWSARDVAEALLVD